MNALSKLFEVLHLSRGEMTLRRSHRRRRSRRQGSALSCESLEPKQLLAADVAVQFSDLVLDTTDPTTVAIEGKFQDTAVSGTVVKFETNAPLADDDFYVELTSNTPLTNANFLSYVNSGAYDNSKFHRSVSDFVIQGGGFKAPTVAADQPGSNPVAIPTTGTVQNEPGNLNTRGTIAMAKLGGQPDSATSQFFFNLNNNSFLDSDNGGYTQFGSVLGSGMTVVDTIGSALTYDATTYYSNTALSDLPLWNVNQDNIVRPQDFVQIENADVVTESALFTYQVTSSDSAKLTASFDGNGNLVLTPVGDTSGSVDVTVTATSKLDNSTDSDTFSVQLNNQAGPTPVLTAIEEAGNTVLNRDEDGNLYAGSNAIYLGASQLQVDSLAGYTPLAVEDFEENGGKQLILRYTNGNLLTWTMSETWARTGSVGWTNLSDDSAYNTKEAAFNIDFNSDGNIGTTFTDIETTGTVSLRRDSSGNLYAGADAIYLGASQLRVDSLAAYTPLAVEDFGDNGGRQLILRYTNGNLLTWTMSETWARTGSLGWADLANFSAYNTKEAAFNIDFNSDGNIGITFTDIETTGTVSLRRDSSGNLYAGADAIYLGASQLRVDSLAAYTPLAVEDFGDNGGRQLILRHSSNNLLTWSLSETWARTGSLGWADLANFSVYNTKEAAFNIDFNSDGNIGITFTDIETTGTVSLRRDSSGNLYAGADAIYLGASQLRVDSLAAYTPLAVEDFGDNGGRQLILRHSSNNLLTWSLSETWARTGSLGWTYTTDVSSLNDLETKFLSDVNSDGFTGLVELETAGTVNLQRDAFGKIFAGSEPILLGASQLRINSLASYTPVAVEDLGQQGGKQLVLRHSTGDFLSWSMSETWARTGSLGWTYTTDVSSLNDLESKFESDLNDDGSAGIPTLTAIEAFGVTSLMADSRNRLYANSDPIYLGSTHLKIDSLTNYTPIAIESFGGDDGNQLLLQHSSGRILTWSLSATWSRSGSIGWTDPSGFAALEAAFGVEL